jgi:hypothetical protein
MMYVAEMTLDGTTVHMKLHDNRFMNSSNVTGNTSTI